MSDPAYQLGERVRTPVYGDGIVVAVNRGPIRGRMWREVSYTIEIPCFKRPVVYYESDLTRPVPDG